MDKQYDYFGETITLILRKKRIVVCKANLAHKSRYFRCLFTHNFNDSNDKEHIIHYDIKLTTLQNFVDWMNDCNSEIDKIYNVKPFMQKFMHGHYSALIDLLQLSILYMVDLLTQDIIDVLILNWLKPNLLTGIWLIAEDLGLNKLRDVAFSVILDRFESLSLSSILKLSREHFMQILTNRNLKCNDKYLDEIVNKWNKYHDDSEQLVAKVNKDSKSIQCVMVTNYDDFNCKKGYIYCWDNKKFSKLIKLPDLNNNSGKDIVGMQVTGRDFSIYTIGGEYGLGTGQFNSIIRRYCLIYRKWYYQARLPVPRRHMIVAFLDNKLMVVGGIGRHRVKLSTVDVLDIHTGEWTTAANIPEEFTEVPVHCVAKGKLYILKTYLYVYHPEQNTWNLIATENISAIQKVEAIMVLGSEIFYTSEDKENTILTTIRITKDYSDPDINKHIALNDFDLIYDDNDCRLKSGKVRDINIMLLGTHCETCTCSYLHVNDEVRSDLYEDSINPKLGSFFVTDPNTLY